MPDDTGQYTPEEDAQRKRDEEARKAQAERPRPATIERIERNKFNQIVVHVAEGEPFVDAKIARCFPWSNPEEYISVRDSDGKEIALLDDLDGLDNASRAIVEEELRDKIFNPKIRRIIEFKHEFGVSEIRAETDRGEVTFQLRSRDDVRVLSSNRALFRDADGNVYELPDASVLDGPSQRRLGRFF